MGSFMLDHSIYTRDFLSRGMVVEYNMFRWEWTHRWVLGTMALDEDSELRMSTAPMHLEIDV